MANYIKSMNELIVEQCAKLPRGLLFGQNVDAGTYISGLSRNLKVAEGGKIINTANCENTLCGMGFGMMLGGGHSVYLVKQLDFMLLGIDHFVNTWNFIRCSMDIKSLGSFTIIMLVSDQGWQGPQSSVDSFADFCSIARIPCYSLTNSVDATQVLQKEVGAPGFRMIGLSCRMCKDEFLQLDDVYSAEDGSVFQYAQGEDATIACFNFSVPQGLELKKRFEAAGQSASLFSVNYVPDPSWDVIIRDVEKTGRLIVIDDSKSVNLPGYKLLDDVREAGIAFRRVVATRGNDIEFGMTDDVFDPDYDSIIAELAPAKVG